SLADEIKRTAMRWYPAFTVEHLWGPSEKRSEPVEVAPNVWLTARHVLQQMGSEVGRCIWVDTWISITLHVANQLLTDNSLSYDPIRGLYTQHRGSCAGVVVPDVRMPNEFAGVVRANGYNVRVSRPLPQVKVAETNHESERGVLFYPDEAFSKVIPNTGTLLDLRAKVMDMLAEGLKPTSLGEVIR
ncbi:MAG: hypothetical protein WC565_10310, partial [Parcubacteria group bacterium]